MQLFNAVNEQSTGAPGTFQNTLHAVIHVLSKKNNLY